MKKTLFNLFLFAICAMYGVSAHAQRVALKTNAIDWLMLSPNLSLETRLSAHMTLDVGFSANPFPVSIAGYRWNNLRFQPELRYYFARPMSRHFVGLAALGASYRLNMKTRFLHGIMAGVGATYGYAFVLNKNWNMEAEIGVGIAYARAKNFRDTEKAPTEPNYGRVLPVPMRFALSFSYIFD